jgi:hypothetical protein
MILKTLEKLYDTNESYSKTRVPKMLLAAAKCTAAQGEYFEGDLSQKALSIQVRGLQ